jgi:hypothetical protein
MGGGGGYGIRGDYSSSVGVLSRRRSFAFAGGRDFVVGPSGCQDDVCGGRGGAKGDGFHGGSDAARELAHLGTVSSREVGVKCSGGGPCNRLRRGWGTRKFQE